MKKLFWSLWYELSPTDHWTVHLVLLLINRRALQPVCTRINYPLIVSVLSPKRDLFRGGIGNHNYVYNDVFNEVFEKCMSFPRAETCSVGMSATTITLIMTSLMTCMKKCMSFPRAETCSGEVLAIIVFLTSKRTSAKSSQESMDTAVQKTTWPQSNQSWPHCTAWFEDYYYHYYHFYQLYWKCECTVMHTYDHIALHDLKITAVQWKNRPESRQSESQHHLTKCWSALSIQAFWNARHTSALIREHSQRYGIAIHEMLEMWLLICEYGDVSAHV